MHKHSNATITVEPICVTEKSLIPSINILCFIQVVLSRAHTVPATYFRGTAISLCYRHYPSIDFDRHGFSQACRQTLNMRLATGRTWPVFIEIMKSKYSCIHLLWEFWLQVIAAICKVPIYASIAKVVKSWRLGLVIFIQDIQWCSSPQCCYGVLEIIMCLHAHLPICLR